MFNKLKISQKLVTFMLLIEIKQNALEPEKKDKKENKDKKINSKRKK